jgi:transcriptional regulator with XRE-family HTH domain
MDASYHPAMPPARTIHPDAARFGAIVKRARLDRGWTRKKLATRSGMTAGYIAILEYGGNVPSLPTVLELTEVLGVDVGDVMRQLATARTARPAAPAE